MASNRSRVAAVAGMSVLALSLVVGSGMDALAGKNKGKGKNKGNNAKVVRVTEDSMRGWAFYNDQADEGIGPQFEAAPPPKKGKNSAFLDVDNAGGELLSTRAWAGTRIKDLKKLRYTTMTNEGSTAPSLQIGVSFPDSDDPESYQGRLVWVPSQAIGGPVTNGEWQTWNPLRNGGEAFYFSRFAAPFTEGKCTQGSFGGVTGDGAFCTLDEIMADYPGLRINPNGDAPDPSDNNGAGTGILGLRVGSGEGDVDANIDSLEIQLKGTKNKKTRMTVYDFGG